MSNKIINRCIKEISHLCKQGEIRLDIVIFIFINRLLTNPQLRSKLLLTQGSSLAKFP